MKNKLHVYTGEGKGKTTAAMGLALRGLGHGRKTLVAQFMKRGNSGELMALKTFEQARVLAAPPISGFTFRMTEEEKEAARRAQTAFALEALREIEAFEPQTIVLDELGMALSLQMVEEDAARRLIETALWYGETAVTGRNAPPWLTQKADYVSRIFAEKHPYETEGLAARKGVEW